MVGEDMSQQHDYDVVIIGSGIGGLTAGAYLSKNGIKVLICEQHDRPGGYFTSFTRKGYTFDAGIQGCEDSGMLLPMLKQLDLLDRIELRRSKVALVLPDFFHRLQRYSDLGYFYDHFKKIFPNEAKGLDRVKKEAMKFCRVMDSFMHFPNAMYIPTWKAMAKMPAWLLRYGLGMRGLIKFIRLLNTPVEEYLGTFISDKNLIRLLSIGYRGNPAPFSLTFIYTMMDYYYPSKDGVQAIPNLLVQSIIEKGGEVRYKTLVKRIVVEDGRATGVELDGGEIIHAPIIINNGDAQRTFTEMITQEAVSKDYLQSLLKSETSESVFSVYLGVDIPAEDIPIDGCPHVFLMPGYEMVDLAEIRDNPDFYRHALIMISIPTLFDPTLAPKGKSILILQCPASIKSFDEWGIVNGKKTEEYKAYKKEIASQLIANVEKFIPGLSRKIEVQIESTPHSLKRYSLNSNGAAVGWSYHPLEAFKEGLKGILGASNTTVENLYQVGHWAMSPGGAPAGLITGNIVSKTIQKRMRKGL